MCFTSTYITISASLNSISSTIQQYYEPAPCFIHASCRPTYINLKAIRIRIAECSSATICISCKYHSNKRVPMELSIKAWKEAEKWMLCSAGQQHCIMHESIAFLLSESFDKLPFLSQLLLLPQAFLHLITYF